MAYRTNCYAIGYLDVVCAYAEVLVQTSQDLLFGISNILFKQAVTRYADSWHHIKPLWYYLVDVVTILLPISLALPWRHTKLV
ncbi:hypothetical protein P4S73_03050 [Paraglaciecola sp. Hal342]